ncbi:MAG: LEPR-XLL domain-containing protein, partial [Planctomycetota bacterium]
MPHWWNWLSHWAHLHARKEAARDHARYAYPGVSPKKQQAPVEPLEPRMLLSGVPTLLPESNPA